MMELNKEYKVLNEFAFDSDRKRMSVIIEDKMGDRYLYTKGADSTMTPRINWKDHDMDHVNESLDRFATQGLRTLVMAKRIIDDYEYSDFETDLVKIQTSDSKTKDQQLAQLYDNFEQNLDFVGASAIEDKLQNNVAETIATLMSANIRIWVLTGDKQETAIEIAKSCKLIQNGMNVEILSIKLSDDENSKSMFPKLELKLAQLKQKYEIGDLDSKSGYKNIKLIDKLSIVIDGPTLNSILTNKDLEVKFIEIALYARSVICCRVSPKQKALVVRLAKYK